MKACKKTLRVALVGVSGYAHWHYNMLIALADAGRITLRACVIINQEEESARCEKLESMGSRLYGDFDQMLAEEGSELDLCCIPTGIRLHRSMTIAALDRDMHVLVEKPAAGSLEEVRQMQVARDRSGRQVFVGFQNMYADDLLHVKDLLVSRMLGAILRIKVQVCWPRPESYYTRNDWAGRLVVAGCPVFDSPANNAMAHFIMMALFWAGPTRSTMAAWSDLEAHLYRSQEIESFDTLSAKLRTQSGAEILWNMTHSSSELLRPEIVVECERGAIIWREDEGGRVCFTEDSTEPDIVFDPFPETRQVMFRKVVNVVTGSGEFVCDLDMASSHTRFIEELHRISRIQQVCGDRILERMEEGKSYRYVSGLTEMIRSAHATGTLLPQISSPSLVR
ncbi:Gfo/Idh/MocA family protein [Puniceicoccus vermicola]|uniref:Gfo/Idh/MocA family oxidoreductase n=1 Tax=Puniceicoccus vermicola TaxID=388746 RepID=A0A7X1B1K6_9BACT|nr:Gfo/Idh/MocA family oxidoreductase [Puniceicoccus vermicola]MBC2603857.1 Gfo/Idh/MocA family oxidoreductase [Puniceicoccus vermicola]